VSRWRPPYYSVPPGFIGQRVQVQWDELRVRILAPKTGQLLREHVRQKRGWHRLHEDDRPARAPRTTEALLHRARTAGVHLGALCQHIHNHEGEPGVRRILGVLSLAKKHGVVAADEAAQAALELDMPNYRFVRRFLERRSHLPLTLKQINPLIRQLIRQLSLYRNLIDQRTGNLS